MQVQGQRRTLRTIGFVGAIALGAIQTGCLELDEWSDEEIGSATQASSGSGSNIIAKYGCNGSDVLVSASTEIIVMPGVGNHPDGGVRASTCDAAKAWATTYWNINSTGRLPTHYIFNRNVMWGWGDNGVANGPAGTIDQEAAVALADELERLAKDCNKKNVRILTHSNGAVTAMAGYKIFWERNLRRVDTHGSHIRPCSCQESLRIRLDMVQPAIRNVERMINDMTAANPQKHLPDSKLMLQQNFFFNSKDQATYNSSFSSVGRYWAERYRLERRAEDHTAPMTIVRNTDPLGPGHSQVDAFGWASWLNGYATYLY